ncbi:MAG: glycoside hydrolase family 2 [Verrucomicrobia bacterium]|nr:glycoside hydrolase family 2 [Verrucomicrobiota bacterium]
MKRILITLLALIALANTGMAADDLAKGFASPPEQTKPWCYWYWISDNISKDGITRDLEAMARVGIGGALIGNVVDKDAPVGTVRIFSDEWWAALEHAIREAGRVGVEIGVFNGPGWSQSGGPWITPKQAMRYVVSSETRVKGPVKFEGKLPVPKEPFEDIAVTAFPAPRADATRLAALSPRVLCSPAVEQAAVLADGDPATGIAFPEGAALTGKPFVVDFETKDAFTARTLLLYPHDGDFKVKCELQAADEQGNFATVREFELDRRGPPPEHKVNVGPMIKGPAVIAFPPRTSKHFRLVVTGLTGKGGLAEIELTGAARLERFVEKQLGKMFPQPLPLWDAYLWPPAPEPDQPDLAVARNRIVDLRGKIGTDGTLRWDVPEGEWVILRTGMTPTGAVNHPVTVEGKGPECDKMSRAAIATHFDGFVGKLLARMPAASRRAFRRVVIDSYEVGSENWTDGFGEDFRKTYGYDPTPWLPVLTGRIVGSADQSDRFLWDLRRLVADRVGRDYVGGLRDLCHRHGLRLWLENYGHWGFPGEFLQYGGQTDELGGEFWVRDGASWPLGSVELRAASSAANIYGKPVVSAEAFTSAIAPFQLTPAALKARGDWAFCEGINHFVLHVYIHQPWEDRRPGVNAWFGTEFNRHNTWFESGRAWVDYLRRCCWLLQHGTRVADVAYFIGEDAPKMTGVRQPEMPPGCDFDFINAEVILDKLNVRNGLLTLPHGTTYRALVLPELDTMRPEVLRKLVALSKAGAKVIGPAPKRSPSMENYPRCDDAVRRIGAEMRTETRLDIPPDFQSEKPLRFTHRRDGNADIYFVANPEAREVMTKAAFRVTGKSPELWCPVTGRITRPAVYDEADGTVRLPLHLGPHGSVFVVFREKTDASRIVSVTRNGEPLLDTKWTSPAKVDVAPTKPGNFTMSVWAKPAADITILPEANKGVSGMKEPRNDVVFPPHGNNFGGAGHAGSGLSVGRNGVAVFEHGASYFAPVLAHAAPLSDWTHVVVVYRDGQPSLYLNGTLVHCGLKSQHIVLPPSGADTKFRGELGGFESIPHALSDAEITQLMKTTPRPGVPLVASAIELTRDEALAWQPGAYELKQADGKTRTLNVASVPAPQELTGPWEVQFAAEKATFDKLQEWTTRPEETIRHYSGKAIYRKTFTNHQSLITNHRLFLDLGKVHDLATVRLNGQTLRTLWLAPWRVDITDAVRPGRNELDIEVVNTWNNRLVGDRALPAETRQTFVTKDSLPKNAPLVPAGLIGPVTVRAAEKVVVSLSGAKQ